MATKKSTTKKPASKPAAKPAPAPKKGGSTKKAVATPVARTTVSTYVPVSHHIYYDGFSYRVRASVNGTRYSQNFSSKKKAFEFRKRILSTN